jgi:teichuronic acid biosynthesis glycosyltransferase TuaG
MNPLVSIIMPAFNVAPYIKEAINSVLNQNYSNWELIIINNASTDETPQIIDAFNDERIIKGFEAKKGLSRARNAGLKLIRGEYVCFLDADDKLPSNSISARMNHIIKHPETSFVDGTTCVYNSDFTKIKWKWTPKQVEDPHQEMALIHATCYCGMTWLFKREVIGSIEFDPDWISLEDRLFCFMVSEGKTYGYVDEEVYHIRRRQGSLMTDHRQLEKSYVQFLQFTASQKVYDEATKRSEKKKFHLMFFKTYAHEFRFIRAIKHLYHWLKPHE